MAVSRRRETLADVTAVSLTRYPPGLISALGKLRDDTTIVHSASKATAHLWIESPLTDDPGKVVNPREERSAKYNRLFMTHPPIDERIAALMEL
jgi:heat shock protein HtpX